MSTRSPRTALLLGVLVLGLTGCGPKQAPATLEPDPRPTAGVELDAAPPSLNPPTARTAFIPARYSGWLNRIPHGLPLATGMPKDGGEFEATHAPVRLEACGTQVLGRGAAIDTRADTVTGPEFADQHGVLLFGDDRAAADFVERSLTRLRDCETERHGTTTWSLQIRRSPVGPPFTQGFVAIRTYADSGDAVPGADWWEASRFGNAVLVTSMGGEFMPDTVQSGIRQHRRALRPLVASMCVFTPEGCPRSNPDISTHFPLAAGYPGNDDAEGPGFGLEGPTRGLPLGDFELCDRSSTLPRPTDELGAGWSNVEDFRDRHLLTFTDAGAAGDWIGQLRAFWTSCSRERTGAGYVGLQTLRRTSVGGESWALVRHFRYHGAPGIGLVVLQVVRLGRAVLVDQVSNEGGAGPELEAEVTGVLQGMTHASRTPVAAMCVYTEAGCPRPAGALTLGPDGVGSLRLGMTASEAEAAGATLTDAGNGTGCSVLHAAVAGHRVVGDLDPTIGVSMLTSTGVVTPEGAGDGLAAWRAYSAYPDADLDAPLLLASPPGRDDRTYRVELAHGRIASLRLVDPRQHCAS